MKEPKTTLHYQQCSYPCCYFYMYMLCKINFNKLLGILYC